MCGSMVDIQFPTAENRRGKEKKKKERKKRTNYGTQIQWPAIFHRAAIIMTLISQHDLHSVKHVKYLGQRSLSSKIVVRIYRQTHTLDWL